MTAPRPRDAATVAALERRCKAADAATLTNFAWFAARRGDLGTALAVSRRAAALPNAPRSAWRTLERLAAGRPNELLLALTDSAPPAHSAGSPLAAGVAAHRQAAFAVAEACYFAATGENGHAPAAWNDLAVLHEQRGERLAADENWERAIAAGNVAAIHNCALALFRRGDASGARALLSSWAGRVDAPAPLFFLAGYIAFAHDDIPGAVPLLEAAVAAEPHLARAHFTLGLGCERLGRHADALDSTRRALLLSPWYVPQVWLLDRGVGIPAVEVSAEGEPTAVPATDGVLLSLGRSLLETEHFGEALAVFDQVLVHQPSQTAALFHRGVVLAKLRRYGEALEDWELVGRVDPDGPLGAVSRRHARSARQLASLFAAA